MISKYISDNCITNYQLPQTLFSFCSLVYLYTWMVQIQFFINIYYKGAENSQDISSERKFIAFAVANLFFVKLNQKLLPTAIFIFHLLLLFFYFFFLVATPFFSSYKHQRDLSLNF